MKYPKYMDDDYNIKQKYKSYVYGAEKRGLCFEITLKEFIDITSRECHYCGEKDYPCNGIDRVNNAFGYKKKNCVSCCKVCNRMKTNYDVDFFIRHICKIKERFDKRLLRDIIDDENLSRF